MGEKVGGEQSDRDGCERTDPDSRQNIEGSGTAEGSPDRGYGGGQKLDGGSVEYDQQA